MAGPVEGGAAVGVAAAAGRGHRDRRRHRAGCAAAARVRVLGARGRCMQRMAHASGPQRCAAPLLRCDSDPTPGARRHLLTHAPRSPLLVTRAQPTRSRAAPRRSAGASRCTGGGTAPSSRARSRTMSRAPGATGVCRGFGGLACLGALCWGPVMTSALAACAHRWVGAGHGRWPAGGRLAGGAAPSLRARSRTRSQAPGATGARRLGRGRLLLIAPVRA